jgi:hypothetical protein
MMAESAHIWHTYVFHDVEEAIVDVRLLCKLDLDLVQIGQSVLDVERGLSCKLVSVTARNSIGHHLPSRRRW